MNLKNGELITVAPGGKQSVRFKSLNPPNGFNYLLSCRNGLCWPQSGEFRQISKGEWEIDAYFGGDGEYTLQLVTVTELGKALFEYYRKIVRINLDKRKNMKGKLSEQDQKLLGSDYPGITLGGAPKGILVEGSVTITIASKA